MMNDIKNIKKGWLKVSDVEMRMVLKQNGQKDIKDIDLTTVI